MLRFTALVFERHLIWLLLAILVIFGAFVPGFTSLQNILNVMWAAAPLGCMVLGLFLVLLIKEVDLSLESTFAFAPTSPSWRCCNGCRIRCRRSSPPS